MCFPWAETEAVTDWTACRRSSDCSAGRECYRHPDRRSVHTGICLHTREATSCSAHQDCEAGLLCVAGWCGDRSYFSALQAAQCDSDLLCQDLLLGTDCCLDVAAGLAAGPGTTWGKRCCDNPRGPVTQLSVNVTVGQLERLDNKIRQHYRPWSLDQAV